MTDTILTPETIRDIKRLARCAELDEDKAAARHCVKALAGWQRSIAWCLREIEEVSK